MIRVILLLILSPVLLSAQIKNMILASQSDDRYPPVEPSIVINPDNVKNIVAGIALDRAVYTTDGGLTWSESTLQSSFGVAGDPVLIADQKGNIYYFHLSGPKDKGRDAEEWLDRISVQKSTNKGASWKAAAYTGLRPPFDNDKPWAASHPKKDLIAVTWTQFEKYGSADTAHHSNIMFSRSSSKGDKWSDPIRINNLSGDCLDSDYTVEGAVPAISYDDKIYIVWSHGSTIYMDRSFDDGRTWLKSDLEIAQQIGGWDMSIPGLSRCNGFPSAAVDNSGSPFHGSLYVAWADQRNGETDTDIWTSRTANRGDNWSTPIRVNQDNSKKHQFLPQLAVDQTNGILYLIYYDRRNYNDNQTDVYLAWSVDGGNKFSEIKLSEKPFIPSQDYFLGDYLGISAHKNVIAAAWTRMDDGKTQIVGAIFNQSDLPKK